ncbi:MAG: ClpXP protease specificity-enhancing factor [Ferrovum sp. 37-45-19]|nr:MAG: ClpXP protease specificity-enhancing factor [Ferrovum sp. 21-44-67]OYV94570.1 MAG: ClpXP protease specificity-enhancing factor [Ferrovum sp. 37-45-19]OZB32837.1 MAG: ClpXP protease specificity-enhancing factor [Ferrovum sp. 34-44-207]HQT81564.1 ClpXP protease specificity-enhancing factor [Ferrovaceae bacterium]HQU06452.1 ClpXP protease specificity-enhancing factor [Ferrovaceae bacterium]
MATSTKPYISRALWEWCCDNGLTPLIHVAVNPQTRVPVQFVKDGQIVLNISPSATRGLQMGNDFIQFNARFGGVSQEVSVPWGAVMGLYAKETGEGMFFEMEADDSVPDEVATGLEEPSIIETESLPSNKKSRPNLTIIK